MSLINNPLKPSDCIMAFAIPVIEKSFNRNRNRAGEADFTRRNLLTLYKKQFIVPAKSVIRAISKKGVKMVFDCTLNDLKNIFTADPKAIMLFAHNVNDRLELFDGLYDIHAVNEIIPDKGLFLDLNACMCDSLGRLIGASKTNVIVRYGQERITLPLFWTLFYEYFFELLRQKDLNYFDAILETKINFQKHFNHENRETAA